MAPPTTKLPSGVNLTLVAQRERWGGALGAEQDILPQLFLLTGQLTLGDESSMSPADCRWPQQMAGCSSTRLPRSASPSSIYSFYLHIRFQKEVQRSKIPHIKKKIISLCKAQKH